MTRKGLGLMTRPGSERPRGRRAARSPDAEWPKPPGARLLVRFGARRDVPRRAETCRDVPRRAETCRDVPPSRIVYLSAITWTAATISRVALSSR